MISPSSCSSYAVDLTRYTSAVDRNATVDDAIDYAKHVVAGRIVAGKLLIQAAKRFLRDLEHGEKRGVKFSRSKATHSLRFFPLFCVHIEGELAGSPIVLEPWQAFIVAQLFGWQKRNSKGKWVRRFRYAYIEVARKNGKSTLLSGIALYMLALDGEKGAQVWCAAVDKDQAKIVFDASVAMVEESEALSEILKVTKSSNKVELPTNHSKYGPLSRESKKMDGKNVHCGIMDELHAHIDRSIFDLIRDGMTARQQPICAAITTAGTNKLGICYEQRKYCADILDENSDTEDDDYLAVIFSIDDDDDPHDEAVWAKANPCLEVSKSLDALRSQSKMAKISGAALVNYLIKDLNRWVDGGIRWMDKQRWLACAAPEPANLSSLPCWLGVDLSIKGDVTALVDLFETQPGRYYCKPEFYYPKESLKGLPVEIRELFLSWQKSGHLTILPGYMIDLDKIEARIVEKEKQGNIREVCVDPWKAHQLNFRLNQQNITALDVGQTVRNFSEIMETIDGRVNELTLLHDGNPMMAWMMGNIEVTIDKNDNIFPYKAGNDRVNKIDGGTALFTGAFRAFIGGGKPMPSIYNSGSVTC